MHRTFWKQRPHLINLCLAFIYHSASLTHRRRSANMLWIGKLLHLFWKQAHLTKFLQNALVFFSSFSDFPLNYVHQVRNHLRRVTKPVSYVLLPCLLGQGVQSPGQRGHHPLKPPESAEASFPESPQGCDPCGGPQVKGGNTCQNLGGEGWGRVGKRLAASLCACSLRSHKYCPRLEAGVEGRYCMRNRGDSRGGSQN